MATVVVSPLAQICKAIAAHLDAGIGSAAKVTIGNPGDNVPDANDGHQVNMFFFRFEPYAFDADAGPGETWYVRMHCLVTPFAVAEGNIGTGDTDLRLVGEVLRVFGETPVFSISVDGEPFHVQVIFQNLGLDHLNQLWSTQGDVVYRPSLLYEISLAPVIPRVKKIDPPLVGSLAGGVRADMDATLADGAPPARPLPVMRVDTDREDWAPAISFVIDGACAQFLGFEVGSPELGGWAPRVTIAGAIGTPVTLSWDVWDAQQGWRAGPAGTAAAVSMASIDPDHAAEAITIAVPLPFDDHAGQAVLYASRSYRRGADGVLVTVRSNPLLVNLHEASP